MVVGPRWQGRGVGSVCLGAALNHRVPPGETVALSTNEHRNVVFYERLGFQLLGEHRATKELGNITTYEMKQTM
jgi:GNAT superfamily N-acetyltransferase